MISKLIPLLLFCAIIIFLMYLERKSWFGVFLNKKIKPIYNRLKFYLSEIKETKICDTIINSAIKNLKTLYKVYKEPPKSDTFNYSKDIFDNSENFYITDAWAVFYIHNYIINSNFNMIDKNYLQSEIEKYKSNKLIPQSFFINLA